VVVKLNPIGGTHHAKRFKDASATAAHHTLDAQNRLQGQGELIPTPADEGTGVAAFGPYERPSSSCSAAATTSGNQSWTRERVGSAGEAARPNWRG
ncbi:hypothetical protein, partial [Streptomyces goshikiensis]|uniref:hypothetical protein n=1 Tax=Streptomyces goshikiensis TaxID=1942 RepID=UPI0036DA3554